MCVATISGEGQRRPSGLVGPTETGRPASTTGLTCGRRCRNASRDDDAIPDSSSTSSSTSSTSTSTSQTSEPDGTSSTTTAPDDVEALVTARYLEFWDARFEANTEPVDPDSARLRDLATGDQLTNVVAETQQRKDSGLALRTAEDAVKERRVRLVDVQGDTATIQDCATNDDVVYRVATGEVLDDSVVTRNISAEMRLVDGRWRLAAAQELQKWEGVAGCALSSDS